MIKTLAELMAIPYSNMTYKDWSMLHIRDYEYKIERYIQLGADDETIEYYKHLMFRQTELFYLDYVINV